MNKKNIKILIADDSIIARNSLKSMLVEEYSTVLTANDGSEALDIIFKQKPDIVILDLLMPKIKGTEVLAELKEKSVNVNVIVVSADIQQTTKEKCRELGARAFLNKPPTKSDLLSELEKVIAS